MYYTAKAEIQIGKVKIHGATEVEIESSVDAIGGTAKLKTEFTSYIAHIGDTTPLVLECDDAWHTFKHAAHIIKNIQSVPGVKIAEFQEASYTDIFQPPNTKKRLTTTNR